MTNIKCVSIREEIRLPASTRVKGELYGCKCQCGKWQDTLVGDTCQECGAKVTTMIPIRSMWEKGN